MAEQRCENCRFWARQASKPSGKCRRFPPESGPSGSSFPATAIDDWCGEWTGDGMAYEAPRQEDALSLREVMQLLEVGKPLRRAAQLLLEGFTAEEAGLATKADPKAAAGIAEIAAKLSGLRARGLLQASGRRP